jgi:aminoglycoside phosphotransferase (APT) family kinase protein
MPDRVEVVVGHHDCATLRVGDTFLKVDADQGRTDVEVAAMALAPVPTPEVRWRTPPVLALAALPGAPIARLGAPSTASPAVWAAVGATLRRLHDAPPPPWPARGLARVDDDLAAGAAWLVDTGRLPAAVVDRNRRRAEAVARRPWPPAFIHGDLHVAHVFVAGDEVTGLIDWTEAGRGDGLLDLAALSLGHPERLPDVLAGYGEVDLDAVRDWWSFKCLRAVRWLAEHGFDPVPELAVLRELGRG